MENQHFCRQRHILLLIRDSKISNDHLLCEICNSLVAAPYYVCDSCKYYAHKSCTELPRQINHSIHPRHPLSLLTQKVFFCDSCQQNFKNTLCFSCIQCNFDLDVECAQMSNSITCPEGQEHSIRHSSHPHLLRHIERKINKDIKIECFACKNKALDSSSGVYYGCIRCNYFLHKTCIDELPQEILNTLHPHHGPLTLYARLFKCTCRLCDKKENHTLSYECPQCDFRLCVQCCLGDVRRTIRYEDHEHLLCFVEKIYTKLGDRCNAYNTNCNLPIISNCTEFDATISSAFRCLDCDFVLHLLCGPLPSTIKHEFHTDPLVLVELLIEDDSGQFYCDVCETERNPRIRAYYCHRCKYIVHVHCVISEIKNVLSGDLIDVKLKTVGEDIWTLPIEIDNAGVEALIELGRSFLTLKNLIDKLPEDELRILKNKFYWDEDYKGEVHDEVSQRPSERRTRQLSHGDGNIDKFLMFSSFTERHFKSFISYSFRKDFYRAWKLKINSTDLEMKLVDVQGYLIPLTFASVMKNVLYKYGDISLKSKSSQTLKSITFFFLCRVMKMMHSTFVADISEDLLQNWYYHIEFALDLVKFDVSLFKAPLEEITKAFFFLQVSELEMEVPVTLQLKIKEYKAKLETCKKFCESSSKQEFMKEGLNKVVKWKWKTLGEVPF